MPQPTHCEAQQSLAVLEGYEPKRHSLRHWQAAYTLMLYGMKWEVRMNACAMNEKTWRNWMSKRYPKNHECLSYERAKTDKWSIYEILPEETDF